MDQSNKLEKYLDSNPEFLAQYLQRRMQVAVTSYLKNNPGFLNDYLHNQFDSNNKLESDIGLYNSGKNTCSQSGKSYNQNGIENDSSFAKETNINSAFENSYLQPTQLHFSLHGQQTTNSSTEPLTICTMRYQYNMIHKIIIAFSMSLS